MNSRAMLLLATGLVLAAGTAGYLGYQTTQEARQETLRALEQAEKAKHANAYVPGKVPVVVAQKPIAAYQKITAADIALDFVTIEPPHTFRKIEDLLGQVLQADVAAGQLVEQEHLQPGSEVARLLKPGERAVAIAIDEVVGGGGFVQPGDTVDVLLYVPGDMRPASSAQIVMRALRVVGLGSQIIGPEGGAQSAEKDQARSERQRARTAVLAVAEADVTRLMLASSVGILRLAIRPAGEVLSACQGEANADCVTGLAAIPLTPGKTGPGSNSLVRAGTLVSGMAAGTPRASAPARSAPGKPSRPAEPPILIFRGLNNSTYP